MVDRILFPLSGGRPVNMTVGRYRLPLRRVAALETIMRATEGKAIVGLGVRGVAGQRECSPKNSDCNAQPCTTGIEGAVLSDRWQTVPWRQWQREACAPA